MNASPLPGTSTNRTTEATSTETRKATWISRLRWPNMTLILSALLLGISNLFEYWHLTLNAPQYPDGLRVTLFTHKLEGDVFEVDGLNHYIGMMPLGDAAEFERSIAIVATAAFVIMGILAGVLATRKWAWLALPIIAFPIAFVADLFYWLYRAGHDLDPSAALSSSIHPFTPTILGHGVIGQFSTDAMFGLGFWITVAAALLALAGLVGRLRPPKDES